MPAEAVRAIVGDQSGHLWIGTSGGILRLDREQFDSVLRNPQSRLAFRAYNASDGLAGMPVRTGVPNAVRSTDGRLWFVTANGVTVLDPERLSPTRPAPPVRIERITANGRTYESSGPVVLPAGTTHLQIEYGAGVLLSPARRVPLPARGVRRCVDRRGIEARGVVHEPAAAAMPGST
ncbi:MAG: two-component regulator propeller domain-containing protein [Vicinamibacterales bacterium]